MSIHEFPGIGRKIMLLNARLVSQGPNLPRIILLAIEDITERRLTEWRLAEQHRELQRSNAALDEFASVASHDLQEPLRKILSFGDLLSTSAGLALEGNAREYLARMLSAAARMRTLISDLLLYSQVSTRVQPFVSTDLGRIAGEVVADLETVIAESGGRVEVGALPVIAADPLQMRQLLQNLLGNSLKYRRKDTPPVVRLSCSSPDARHRAITVTDNGIGFDEKHATKIFGMFTRLHGRAQYAGSGIGLAICRTIVERHGGTIAATSAGGNGATFTVTLPVNAGGHKDTCHDARPRTRSRSRFSSATTMRTTACSRSGPWTTRTYRTTCDSSRTANSCSTTSTSAESTRARPGRPRAPD